MRDNRDKWRFIQHKTKPVITPQEVAYWKGTLKKILKIGTEFEFNLPEQKGTCKGDSNACPCVKMGEDNCWVACAKTVTCLSKPSFELCAQQTGTCEPDECNACGHYKPSKDIDCNGIFCPGFISACLLCKDFKANCGTCEHKYDPKKNPDEIRERITREMNPSQSYGTVTETGVHSITTDGSLLGKKGVEVITVGRRIDYWEFYKMCKNIIDASISKGAYVNERTSIHMHLLASYYGKMFPGDSSGVPASISELEKSLPEIVLANFHQLCRRFQNAITWMTVGLDEPERITRWEKFRVSVLDISAITNTMSGVKESVSQNAGGNKYGWVNYNYTTFDKKGDINRLHLEMRMMDCLLSPSACSALACMFYAMMIKAVEISRWGIVEIGDSAWMDQAKKIKDALMNGTGDYGGDRFSNTKNLHKYHDILTGESLDIVRQLKHILIKIGPAYEVLEKLAERPCGIRRCQGETWEDIEKDLSVIVTEDDVLNIAVAECIDLRYVTECQSVEEWISEISKVLREDEELGLTKDDEVEDRVSKFVDHKVDYGEIIWSESLGAMLMI